MKTFVFGKSYFQQPLIAHRFQKDRARILILGGIHGDETEGIAAADALLASLIQDNSFDLDITIVPRANPDGALHNTRGNGQGVDLNRNLPTKDWSPEIKTPRYHPGQHAGSEPENQALIALIESLQPHFILSLHSWHPVININGECMDEANALAQVSGYKIDADIGYPTPGCLGTYTGLERQIPTITYEIERGLATKDVVKIHIPAIREMLKSSEKRNK